MANAEPTLEQILETVRQLPEPQRQRLLKEIEALPRPANALAAARRLRAEHRMEKQQRQRISKLLAKGNAGLLSAEEKTELNCLVDEFEKKTLELAQALVQAVKAAPSPRSRGVVRLGCLLLLLSLTWTLVAASWPPDYRTSPGSNLRTPSASDAQKSEDNGIAGHPTATVPGNGSEASVKSEELQKLQGTWVVTSIQFGPDECSKGEIPEVKLIIQGNSLTDTFWPRPRHSILFLDPKSTPKTITLYTPANAKNGQQTGIYEVEGNQLKLAFNPPGVQPPTSFAAPVGPDVEIYSFRRTKPNVK
jgi:uncharacterized protein (TIGR03067 family)